MTRELWKFFLKKYRKGNGMWWALGYARLHWQWLVLERRHDRNRGGSHAASIVDCPCWGRRTEGT